MSEFTVRSALPKDLERLYQIFRLADKLHRQAHPEIFREVHDPAEIKDYLLLCIQSDDAAVFVAELNVEIIGAVIAWERQTHDIPMLIKRTFVSVDNLVVVEGCRNMGVGQSLMDRVHLWAQTRGLKEIQLTVWDFNEGAQAFYKKLGYEMLHHRMRKELP